MVSTIWCLTARSPPLDIALFLSSVKCFYRQRLLALAFFFSEASLYLFSQMRSRTCRFAYYTRMPTTGFKRRYIYKGRFESSLSHRNYRFLNSEQLPLPTVSLLSAPSSILQHRHEVPVIFSGTGISASHQSKALVHAFVRCLHERHLKHSVEQINSLRPGRFLP